jgi:hypothetical protein
MFFSGIVLHLLALLKASMGWCSMIYSFSNTTSYSTFYIFFSDNIMADVASKQQTTALFLSTMVTRTRRHTKVTKN